MSRDQATRARPIGMDTPSGREGSRSSARSSSRSSSPASSTATRTPGNILIDPATGQPRVPRPRPRGGLIASSGSTCSSLIYATARGRHPGDRPWAAGPGDPRVPASTRPRFRDDIYQLAHQYLIYGNVGLARRGPRRLPRGGVRRRPAPRHPADDGDQGGHPGRGDRARPVVGHRHRGGRGRGGSRRRSSMRSTTTTCASRRSRPRSASARRSLGACRRSRTRPSSGSTCSTRAGSPSRWTRPTWTSASARWPTIGRQATVGLIVAGQSSAPPSSWSSRSSPARSSSPGSRTSR